jgi:hypothetical protein
MNDIIQKYYENFNFPNPKKLYTILKKDGYNYTQKNITEYLNKKDENQILKPVKKSSTGHIVSYFPNEFWNIDIFDLSKFVKYNNGYKYIFCAIDIFSRHAYCEPMKNKDETNVILSLNKILSESKSLPTNIISDSDSSFLSNKFINFLDQKGINFNTVIVGDHKSLGVIDRFALTIKRIFAKLFIINKKSNWIDYLQKVVKTYNNTVHDSLNDLTPNEAEEKKNYEKVLDLNIKKSKSNKMESDLKPGDKVRILVKTKLSRITDSNWSTEVYIVKSVRFKTVVLTNDQVVKRENLLKVHESNISTIDISKKINQENKNKRYLANEAIDTSNVIQGRTRKGKLN